MMTDTHRLKETLHDGLSELQRLRDEVRLEIHLAGMEAKERWWTLEPKILDAEQRFAREVNEVSRAALERLIGQVRTLRDTMREPPSKR
ncbi:MAG: hypothetical protein JNL79_21245 [Myxococcales bacterium]|nr:hypothetical protein [Myxococcales bacterium]